MGLQVSRWDDNLMTELALRGGCYVFDASSVYAASLTLMGFSSQFIVWEVGFLKVLVNSLR